MQLEMSHAEGTRLKPGRHRDHYPTPFPSLTGLRSRAISEKSESVTIDSRLTFTGLHDITNSLRTSSVTALQAAWAAIISTYTATHDDVVFTTAIGLQTNNGPINLSDDSWHVIPTQVCLHKTQDVGQPEIGSILHRLEEANAVELRRSKSLLTSAARNDDQTQHATIIVFKNDACRGDDDSISDSSDLSAFCRGFAISLVACPGPDGFLKLKVCYTRRVLNEAGALMMLKQMDDILIFILSNPRETIADAVTAVRTSMLSISNESLEESIAHSPEDSLLQDQFEEIAKTSPDRVALIFKENLLSEDAFITTTWTYGQLDEKARTLASFLHHRFGQLVGTIIPICMERGPELYVAVLGILKAGGAWCPIDASYPPRRRHDLIARTGARLLIATDPKVTNDIEGIPQGIVTVKIADSKNAVVDHIQRPRVQQSNVAYLMWTSGTTGEPKGVPIHHGAAVTAMKCLQKSIPIDVSGGNVRCLQFSHFTFDVFVQDLFYTWGVGGVIISSNRELMLSSFAELATETKATHAHLTPAFAASVPRERCPTLEVVTMIGEKLPQVVADDWSQNMRAFNTYGPAETTVVSTFRQFRNEGDETQSCNIGFPLTSVSAFIIHDGYPVVKHGIGELALAGPQLSKGYWNDPGMNSKKFVWNQYYSRHLYMTGDLVRQLHDGSFEFIGRTDDLIKVQGVRIELSEIAFSLRSCHPLVKQVQVQYLDHRDRPSKVIVAFLAAPHLGTGSAAAGQPNTSEEAVQISQCAQLEAQKDLPDYMIPRIFLVVNSIPRTASAKINHAMLKELYSSLNLGVWESKLASNSCSFTGLNNWSKREADLIAIIAQLSGTSQSSVNRASSLPSIGIDSISATRLVPMLNAKGFQISVADVFRCKTLDDLMKASNTFPWKEKYDLEAFNEQWCSRVGTKVRGRGLFVAPALPLQESLLGESMQNADAYWSNVFFSLDAQVDMARLHDAWQQVVDDTEALRTGFIPSIEIMEESGDAIPCSPTFLQLLYEESPMDWTYVKFSGIDLRDYAKQRAHAIAERHQKDCFRDPLLAVTVFEHQEGRTMMVSIHHAVRDEMSLELFMEDLRKCYQTVRRASKQRHQLREALAVTIPTRNQIDEDETFWKSELASFVNNEEPKLWPDLSGLDVLKQSPTAKISTQTLPLTTPYKDLQDATMDLGASSVASILRVAWGFILLQYLETDSIVFAETWSSRTEASILADIVGPLITVLPVPFRALGSTREVTIAQSKFQREAGFHRSIHPQFIRKLLRRSENQVLYPAVFNFLPNLIRQSPDDNISIWTKVDDLVGFTVEHPVALTVAQAADGVLMLEVSANERIMSTAHLTLLAQQVDAFVISMLKFPDMPLEELTAHLPESLLSIASVSPSDAVSRAWTQDPTFWVDHYATVRPDWPAVQVAHSLADNGNLESTVWTYADLRSAYNRVAALISRTAGGAQMIAVCLDRGLEAYAVILGILRSGGTYLPIDEDLPGERKSFLLQDSTAAMLFTTKLLAASFPSIPPRCRIFYVDDNEYLEHTTRSHSIETYSYPKASDNAYLLYTSGSTGLPKGVLVSRGNLCSFIEGLSEFICPHIPKMNELPGKGRYLGLASRAFDVHLAEMFLAWHQGMAAVTAPRSMLLDNLQLALRKLRITHASFVPSLIDQAGLDPHDLPDIRYLGVGGEKMSKRVIDAWAPNQNVALINAYGPTEMSIGCCAAVVTPDSSIRNVGRPFGKTTAHVLVLGSTRHTMRGVSGELCLTGDLVANGYHNRPDAGGFVDFHGSKMYRTGDRVRLMADNSLEILGREDDQTKVRGQRLEMGEVSEVIRTFIAKRLDVNAIEVATLVAQHPSLSKPQLVSFIVLDSSSSKVQGLPEILNSSDADDISEQAHAHCQNVLPSYMIPDLVIPITKMPLAPASGKADGKRLKTLFSDMSLSELMSPAPSEASSQPNQRSRMLSEAENNVRNAVVRTLAIHETEVSPNTNIFRLGLDSLNAINLACRLQKLGYECSVASVLRNPLLEKLAVLPLKTHIDGAQVDKLAEARIRLSNTEARFRANQCHGLEDTSICAVRPCLPLQESLVAASLAIRSKALYVNHVPLKLSANINYDQLFRAWVRVVAGHEILRTCFQTFENGILQVVLQHSNCHPLCWECTTSDLSLKQVASRPQQANIAQDIISNISTKPPIRLNLFRSPTPDEGLIFLVSIHHALYDAESFHMILEDVYMRYQSATPQVRTPFATLIDYVYSQDQQKSRGFWCKYLAHFKPNLDMNRAITTDHAPGKDRPLKVDRALVSPLSDLEEFSHSMSGTPSSTIQAVFGVALAQTLRARDIVFGAVLSGRTLPIEKPDTILASCITTVPQRVNLCGDHSSVLSIIKDAQKGFVESLEFQHTALRHIHRWIGAERPLFDYLFSYVRKRTPAPYSHLWTELEGSMTVDFPLAVEFEADHEADRMRARCSFSPEFGTLDTVNSLLENVDLLLGALIRQENVTVQDLGIVDSDAVNSIPKQQWDAHHWSHRELKMRELIAEICEISPADISKGASFFTLGIDSITAIRFAQRLRQLGIECSSADVLRYSCIGKLCHRLDVASLPTSIIRNTTQQPQNIVLKEEQYDIPTFSLTDTIIDLYVCTPLQSSMLTQTLGSGGRLYVHHHSVLLSTQIDLVRLKQSWERLVAQTEILRTTFRYSRTIGSWSAAVHKESTNYWTECDATPSMSDSVNDITMNLVFSEETDFGQPPWRIHVLKNLTEVVLMLSMHHSLYDGESIDLLFQDLTELYEGIHLHPRLPFSTAAKEISRNRTIAEDFWIQRLADFENSDVLEMTKSSETNISEAEITLKMSIENILRGCKKFGVTLQTVALLAYGKSLAYVSGHRDVVFGHVVGGRSLPIQGADGVVGPLFNTVPFRLIFDKTYVTNMTAAIEVQQSSGDSQPHQHASLGKIQQAWPQKIRDPDAQLFNTLFVFQKGIADGLAASRLWTPIKTVESIAPTEYSTNFEFEQRKHEAIVRVVSRRESTTQQQLCAWLTKFEQIFQDILERPHRSVMAFPTSLQGLPLAIQSDKKSLPLHYEIEPGPDLESIRSALSECSRLSFQNITLNASIYSMGLDSIVAIKVAAACRKHGYGVTVADVLQGRNLRGICRKFRARNVKQGSHVETGSHVISAASRLKALTLASTKDEDVEDVLPCLSGQVYHFANWLNSGRTMGEAIWTYDCSDRLKVENLKSAWRRLRERHSILRTTFVAVSPNEIIQVVLSSLALRDDSFQYQEAPDAFSDSVVEMAKQEVKQPFDLFTPPCKLHLIRSSSRDYILLKLHHATYDAWTMPTIIGDLAALYRDLYLPSPPKFESLIQRTIHSLNVETQKTYWRKSLDQCRQTFLEPPATRSKVPISSPPKSTPIFVSIKGAVLDLQVLEDICRNLSLSVHTILLTAFARTLACYSSIKNPTFGLLQAGRSASFEGIDQLCAPCLNVTPVLVRDVLSHPASVSAKYLQSDLAKRIPFEQSYLHDILDWVGFTNKPLFNTYMNILWHETERSPKVSSDGLFIPRPHENTMDLASVDRREGKTAIDGLNVGIIAEWNLFLDVERSVEDDALHFGIRCDSELMDEGQVRRFASEVVEELTGLVQEIGREC